MKELVLSQIWIYPIKSLGGVALNSSKVLQKGLQHDRRWMLVDEHGVFMTQRLYPEMALFKISLHHNHLTIFFKKPGHETHPSITFAIDDKPSQPSLLVKIWDDVVNVHEVDEKLSQWFSTHLMRKCKLVSFPENNSRPVDPVYKVNDEHVSLADAFPFLIIGVQTLDDLNSKLTIPLPMDRFRPNFVFTGGVPYEEDTWRNFTIGKNRFVSVKPCARCVLTTVDQHTAEKGVEPLATLSTYRKRDNKIYFGQNLVAIDHLDVTVGDQIILR
jgi:uncharacterized protein YcbX